MAEDKRDEYEEILPMWNAVEEWREWVSLGEWDMENEINGLI